MVCQEFKENVFKKDIIVVGGLPNPIGGVTGFVSRLAASGMVSEVWDIYPDQHKIEPQVHCPVRYLGGKISLYFSVLRELFKFKESFLFFNFSKPKSILFFLLLPKGRCHFSLMLHHGDLFLNKFEFFYKIGISKVDRVYCLSGAQFSFFKSLGVSHNKLFFKKSYLPYKNPSSLLWSDKIVCIDRFFRNREVLVCSGYPSSIYNHDWCVEFAKNNPRWYLAIFIYGGGDITDELIESCKPVPNAKIFFGFNQFEFNYALERARAYLRPNSTDSFGIAVADAVAFNVPVLASDVCERYPGSCLFSPKDYQSFEIEVHHFLEGNGNLSTGDVNEFCFNFE